MIEYNPEKKEGASSPGRSGACVVGIGGAGANVLDRIALENMVEIELVSMNTDIRALTNAVSSRKVQLGAGITRGLGAGGDPELGREAAQSAQQSIREVLKGKGMIFLCVGLGGGTGSGAAPLVAQLAKETGAFVVVFATMPFSFEGRRRVEQARKALGELEEASDALIVFENDKMGQLVLSKSGVQEAFAAADQMIGQSVRAVTTLVTQPGLIRIGMDDLMTALRNADSRCLFGYGSAKGKNRSQEALKRAMKSPLLDGGRMIDRAGSVLVHIMGGESMTLYEVELLMKELSKYAGDQAHVLFGVAVDEKLGESLTVTVISSVSDSRKEVVEESDGEGAEVEEEQGSPPPLTESADPVGEEDASSASASGDDGGKAVAGEVDGKGSENQVEMELLCGSPPAQDEGVVEAGPEGAAETREPSSGVAELESEQRGVAQQEAGELDDAAGENADKEDADERQGGLGLNLLPRVFGRRKEKSKEASPEPTEESAETELEEGDPFDSAEGDGVGEDEVEKTSVIASFVDRSQKEAGEEAGRTAEPATVSGRGVGEGSKAAAGEAVESEDQSAELVESGEPADQGALALDEGKAGRFIKGEPTIVDGEDLDVPTFLRKKDS